MPIIEYNNKVMVPAEQIFVKAGCSYQESNNSISITRGDIALQLDCTSNNFYVNGRKLVADSVPVRITDSITGMSSYYVSLEFVADMLGFSLEYEAADCCYTMLETEFTGLLEWFSHFQSGSLKEVITKPVDKFQIQNMYYEWTAAEDAVQANVVSDQKKLTKVVAYSTEKADVVELYGISKENIFDFMDNGMLVFELKNVTTDMEAQFFSDFSVPHLHYTLLTPLSTIRLFFMIPEEDHWFIVENQDCVQVYFTSEPTSLFSDSKMIIPVHENVKLSDISDKDNYLDHNFEIKISGNYMEFYHTNLISNPYYNVKNINIFYDEFRNQTIISITTGSICGYQYTWNENSLSVTIAKPDEIYSDILILDAGHGGTDPGAQKNGIMEKDINFTILNTYVKDLFQNYSDIKVYFTRETDVLIDLYDRAAFASEIGADLFISLHMNANNSSSPKGTQVYYSNNNNTKLESGFSSYQLARMLVDNLSLSMETKNRGVTSADFVVVKYNTVPAVLIELGFMTNSSDLAKITNPAYQQKAAISIYQTVLEVFNQYY